MKIIEIEIEIADSGLTKEIAEQQKRRTL